MSIVFQDFHALQGILSRMGLHSVNDVIPFTHYPEKQVEIKGSAADREMGVAGGIVIVKMVGENVVRGLRKPVFERNSTEKIEMSRIKT